MTTMLEKMAEAISEAAAEAALYEPGRGVSLEEARIVARAALQAIREPGLAIVMVALRDNSGIRANIARQEFTAMIDAILGGKA